MPPFQHRAMAAQGLTVKACTPGYRMTADAGKQGEGQHDLSSKDRNVEKKKGSKGWVWVDGSTDSEEEECAPRYRDYQRMMRDMMMADTGKRGGGQHDGSSKDRNVEENTGSKCRVCTASSTDPYKFKPQSLQHRPLQVQTTELDVDQGFDRGGVRTRLPRISEDDVGHEDDGRAQT